MPSRANIGLPKVKGGIFMEAKFKVNTRKELVEAISRNTESKAEYLGAPSMAYKIDEFTVTKDGTVVSDDDHALKVLIEALGLEGIQYEPVEHETRTHSISLPMLEPEALTNLRAMIDAKAELLKQALGTDDIPVIANYEESKISFPWFPEMGPDEVNAYTLLLTKMADVAKARKRVTAKPHEIENAKYSFRCFLLSLGFIGDEYKGARKVLLRNLEGSAAFKNK